MIVRLTLVFGMLLSSNAFAQEPAAVTPGEEHKRLHSNLGERMGMMKMWPGGPESEPMMIPVKETNTSLHNGLWVRSEFECGPYMGSGVLGYDLDKKVYVGNWINNTTAEMSVMTGTYNKEKHELTMTFRGKNNMGKMVDMKSVTRSIPGKPELFIMMEKTDAGTWRTSFEVTYEDKK
ncbi:MAG: DUF1579 family protein [Fuerstiella sp.]